MRPSPRFCWRTAFGRGRGPGAASGTLPWRASGGWKELLGTQVNLDFRDEADMVQMARLGIALQPVATALFANSPFRDGKPTGYLSWRSHVWTDTVSAAGLTQELGDRFRCIHAGRLQSMHCLLEGRTAPSHGADPATPQLRCPDSFSSALVLIFFGPRTCQYAVHY